MPESLIKNQWNPKTRVEDPRVAKPWPFVRESYPKKEHFPSFVRPNLSREFHVPSKSFFNFFANENKSEDHHFSTKSHFQSRYALYRPRNSTSHLQNL